MLYSKKIVESCNLFWYIILKVFAFYDIFNKNLYMKHDRKLSGDISKGKKFQWKKMTPRESK